MARYILAIIAILLFTSLAWVILGATIMQRTFSASSRLERTVESNWGRPQVQAPPVVTMSRKVQKVVDQNVDGKLVPRSVEQTELATLSIEQSRVAVTLDLEQRRKGLRWFATYRVAFTGRYLLRNTTPAETMIVRLDLPVPDAVYDDLVCNVGGVAVPITMDKGSVVATVRAAPGAVVPVHVGYRSQGMESWQYSFGENVVQVRDFRLDMRTDFDRIDFPRGTVSPTEKRKTAEGWQLTWKYTNLLTGFRIGMVMPEKLQPGPLAGRISFFAPVSLLFFFFVMFIITTIRRIALHPMHYFFLSTAFFAFHLLLAYLVDHISIHLAFVICSAVSLGLVISYLRIVVGSRFAFVEAAVAQLVYLVGFSYAFFFEGFTGLAVTIGAILTLFLVMQMTARIDWSQRSPAGSPTLG